MANDSVVIDLKAMDMLTVSLADAIAAVHRFADDAGQSMKRVESESSGMLDAFSKLGNVVTGVRAGFEIFGTAVGTVTGILQRGVRVVHDWEDAASAAEAGDAKLRHTLELTGHAAGFTFDRIQEIANELQDLTRFEDDATKSAADMLAVFKSIRGSQFEETLRLSADMAEKMGGNIQSAARMLGRALESPGEGLRMLRRIGVEFTEEEMKMIKGLREMGHTVEAQDQVLAKLRERIGGLAEVMGDTWHGKMARVQNKLGDMAEVMGAMFLPALEEAIEVMDVLFNAFDRAAPAVQAFVDASISGAKAMVDWKQVGEDLMDVVALIVASATTLSEDWDRVWKAMGTTVTLAAVTMYEDMRHLLEVQIPTLAKYVWSQVVHEFRSGMTFLQELSRPENFFKPWGEIAADAKRISDQHKPETSPADLLLLAGKRQESPLERLLKGQRDTEGAGLMDRLLRRFTEAQAQVRQFLTPRERETTPPRETTAPGIREGDLEAAWRKALAGITRVVIEKEDEAREAKFEGLEDLNKRIQAAAASTKPEDKIVRAIEVAQEAIVKAVTPVKEILNEGFVNPLGKQAASIGRTLLGGLGLDRFLGRGEADFGRGGVLPIGARLGEERLLGVGALFGERPELSEEKKEWVKQAERDAAAKRELEASVSWLSEMASHTKKLAESAMPAVLGP